MAKHKAYNKRTSGIHRTGITTAWFPLQSKPKSSEEITVLEVVMEINLINFFNGSSSPFRAHTSYSVP
jgi:hypothetical protein